MGTSPTGWKPASQSDPQLAQATKDDVAIPFHAPTQQSHLRKSPHHRPNRNLPFHPGQHRAHAVMLAMPERDVLVLLAADIQAIGIFEDIRVTIGRAERSD